MVRDIKPEPQVQTSSSSIYSNGASQSQKKRLLAKAQSECVLNVPKQEPQSLHNYPARSEYLPTQVQDYSVPRDNTVSVTSQSLEPLPAPMVHRDPEPPPPTFREARDMMNPRDFLPHVTRDTTAVRDAIVSGHSVGKPWPAVTITQSFTHPPASHLSPQHTLASTLALPTAATTRVSPQQIGGALYPQGDLYPPTGPTHAVYVATTQPAPTYLPPAHQVTPFTAGALPPPAHHGSGRPVIASSATHPLPAHLQPAAVFPTRTQVAPPYAYPPLSPGKSQYQHLWYE